MRRRAGRFELADGGTLFLDEIANASSSVQEKLLRVIEYGAYDRLGGSETQHVDVRVIAATHADLPALARAGQFRADLLDRLAFDVVAVPALRQRAADIPLLATQFARRMAGELGHALFAGFSAAALDQLRAYDWPGNVRELRNAVERSLCRAASPARPLEHIVIDPFAAAVGPAALSPGTGFTEQMRSHAAGLLRTALAETGHNQRAAARLLGLSYDQLRHQLRLHGLAGRKPDSG